MKKLQISLLQNSLLFFLFQLLLQRNAAVLTPSNDQQQDQQIENIVQGSHQQNEKQTEQIYWAVAKGKVKGIYKRWEECLENIRDYPDAYFRTFDNVEEAKYFIDHPDEFQISLEGGSQTGQREYFYNDADDRTIKQIDGTEKERFVARPTKFDSLLYGLKSPNTTVRAVFTDGSTGAGQTSIGVFWGDGDPKNCGEIIPDAKKDSGELHAIIRAMEDGLKLNLEGLAIMTDYKHGIIVIKEHLEKLKDGNNEWRNAHGSRIAPTHIELYRKIKKLRLKFFNKGFPVYFVKVDAHSGVYGNNQADRLARKARNVVSHYVVPNQGIFTNHSHTVGTGLRNPRRFLNKLPKAIDFYLKEGKKINDIKIEKNN